MTQPVNLSDLDGSQRCDTINANTLGVTNAQAIPYVTQGEADAAYALALHQGLVRRVNVVSEREKLDMSHINTLSPLSHPDTPAIVDAIPRRWYSFVVARNPGVYVGAEHTTPNTAGITGNVFGRYTTHELARANFLAELAAGHVFRAIGEQTIETL
ncbi:hypothetical protein BJ912DRAFT_924488 [Pholiota molesta]|nr:hypothetical protein BJ912DRAFT_924488 [Pholiota molesta]